MIAIIVYDLAITMMIQNFINNVVLSLIERDICCNHINQLIFISGITDYNRNG